MFWDVVIAYLGVTLAVAGWNVGVLNCWPAPFAMIFATVVAQFLYPNAASWFIEQTRLPADTASFVVYLSLWLALEFAFEVGLLMVINRVKRHGIEQWERIGGAAVGCLKSITAMVFATTIALHSQNLPEAPNYPDAALWIAQSTSGSIVLKECRSVSASLPKGLQRNIISQATPSYDPTFRNNEDDDDLSHSERAERVRSLVNAIKQFQRDAQQLGQ